MTVELNPKDTIIFSIPSHADGRSSRGKATGEFAKSLIGI